MARRKHRKGKRKSAKRAWLRNLAKARKALKRRHRRVHHKRRR
jgi:hypothetical protein